MRLPLSLPKTPSSASPIPVLSDLSSVCPPPPGRDGERGVQPVGSAAEGGVPRGDDGQRLQLQGVHGAPQGHLLPPTLSRQRPEAPQAPRHAALRRVPPLCVTNRRFAMKYWCCWVVLIDLFLFYMVCALAVFSNILKVPQIQILADSDEQEVVQQVQVSVAYNPFAYWNCNCNCNCFGWRMTLTYVFSFCFPGVLC